MPVRHVFFDVNGTLFDPSAMAEPLGDDHSGFAEQLLSDTVMLAMADSLSGDYHDFSDLLETAAARRLGLMGREDLLEAVTTKAGEMTPFDGAGDALQLLNDAGITTGALTNSSTEFVQSLVSRSDLALAPLIGTDGVRAFKPHPHVYATAVSAVEAPAENVVLVTAHSWDALGAKRAGLQVAWLSGNERLPLQLDEQFDLAAPDLVEAARLILSRAG